MKVLIIRFSSIGDIVMTSPVVRCVKKQLGAEVHFATKKSFRLLVENNPYIDKIHLLEDNWKTFLKDLKAEKYDLIIDLHNNLRSRRVSLSLGLKSRKINKLSIQKEVLIHTGISNLPNVHFSERGLETVIDLGVKNDAEGMDFFVPAYAKKELLFPAKSYITIALATAHETKNIPKELLNNIIQYATLPVILLGGKTEKLLGDELQKMNPQKAINLAGECSLAESAAYVETSKLFIGGDTGLLHIAAALKTPTISIWGATIPEFGVAPYYGKYKIPHYLHEIKLPCRPCSKHGSAKCPKKHFNCMMLQDKMAIQQHIEALENI